MVVSGPSELLIDLLCAAARTPGGEVGLLKTAQVAQILGRRREWVYANAGRLGGVRLPTSNEWRFCPRGVAQALAGLDEPDRTPRSDVPETARAPGSSRLAYPPARQVLADRPRRATPTRNGGRDASLKSRER